MPMIVVQPLHPEILVQPLHLLREDRD